MITYLETASQDGGQHFVIGDESLFFLDQSFHQIWRLAKDHVSAIGRRGIHAQKFMFIRMWNRRMFQVVTQHPCDTKMDSDCFTANMLAPLREELISRDRTRHAKLLVIHTDDCSIHMSDTAQRFMQQHQVSRMLQPLHSRNLAPSDFNLFLTVKRWLDRIRTVHEDDPFELLLEILHALPIDE
jgi:hypothetical protein